MFVLDVEEETFALNPMNCLGHNLMFGHRWSARTVHYGFDRDPLGVSHRNEGPGARTGLTRVKRFQLDDYCRNLKRS